MIPQKKVSISLTTFQLYYNVCIDLMDSNKYFKDNTTGLLKAFQNNPVGSRGNEENTIPSNPVFSTLANALPGLCYAVQLHPVYKITRLTGGMLNLLTIGSSDTQALRDDDREAIFSQLVYAEDIPVFKNKIKQLNLPFSTALQTVEYRVNSSEESLKWVQDRFVGVWDAEGKLVGMEGYITEVPASSLRGQFLSHLIAYRDAINVNMISSITDAKGNITFVNDKFCEVSKYREDELLNKNHNIISSGLHPKSFFVEMWRTLIAGNVWHGEIANKAKDGTLYWVDSVIIPIYDEHKKITSYLSLRTLITDRKKAEQLQDRYIGLLEGIAYLIAHRFRAPVCSILGLANVMAVSETFQDKVLIEQISNHLHKSAGQLDKFTQELSDKLYTMEMELRNSS